MLFESIKTIADYILFLSCLLILGGSIILTFKTRFVQIRLLPALLKMIIAPFARKDSQSHHTISPIRALFNAMSTTLGIGTIVAPVIAIYLGGPGALLGFLLSSFFGSAATYTEVYLCIEHRKKSGEGKIMGGPMQYLKSILSPTAAKWYAISCFILMVVWCGAQSNQLAAVLNSSLLGDYRIPKVISGILIAFTVLGILLGGVKRVSSFTAKLVPIMFVLYLGSSFWIILSNLDQLGTVFATIFSSALSPYEMATGTLIGGLVSSLRWGIFKGIQCNEAGLGTQTIPHSMAETEDPVSQGTMAMLSTYTAGFLAFLSGCVALLTGTWENPELSLGIDMVAASFNIYFSSLGVLIIAVSALLFGLGTILGNGFNGSHCLGYLTKNRGIKTYFIGTAFMVFLGALVEAKLIWSLTDFVLAGMALLHMTGLLVYAFKQEPVKQAPESQDSLLLEQI